MIGLRILNKNDKDYFFSLTNKDENREWMRDDSKWGDREFNIILNSIMTTWYVIYDMDFSRNMDRVGLFTTYLYGKRMYIGIIIEDKYRRKGYARKTFKHYLEITD